MEEAIERLAGLHVHSANRPCHEMKVEENRFHYSRALRCVRCHAGRCDKTGSLGYERNRLPISGSRHATPIWTRKRRLPRTLRSGKGSVATPALERSVRF